MEDTRMQQLSPDECKRLATCERTIQKGLGTFFEVGRALLLIRSERLYRNAHETFEEYCGERWDITRSYAHRLIFAAETTEILLPIGNSLPEREAHVRPLASVPKEHRAEVWRDALEEASAVDAVTGKPNVTAKLVLEAVERWHARRVVKETTEQDTRDETCQGREADAIDVASRPVGRDDAKEPMDDLVECPNCHRVVVPDEEDGACPKCHEPDLAPVVPDSEPDEVSDSVEGDDDEESSEDALFRTTEEAWRELYAGRLPVAAARLEHIASKLRVGS